MPGNDGFTDDDSFWDIDTLMPTDKNFGKSAKSGKSSKKNLTRRPLSGTEPSYKRTLSPSVPPPEGTGRQEQEKAEGPSVLPTSEQRPEKIYDCTSGFVRHVEIYPWPNAYSFFSNFRKNALALFSMEGESTPPVPYFSFMPQYHQLTAQQLRFYLFWRTSFKKEIFLRADFSYLLLFSYEIINLPDVLPPEKGVEFLLKLWINYRKVYPKLDKYLSEWIPDYCLIHQVRPEKHLFKQVLAAGRQVSSFREFYLNAEEHLHPNLLLSSYSYRDSKYMTKENASLFETHIPAAMNRFFQAMQLENDPRFEEKEAELQKISRTSYDGAVCVYGEKKRLDIFYTPARTVGTLSVVTDAVKLCENFVRAHCGIRPRLSAPSLTAPMRKVIEEYFKENLPAAHTIRSVEYEDYAQKYEPESKGFSFGEARKIEEQSLKVVDRLSPVFTDRTDFENSADFTNDRNRLIHGQPDGRLAKDVRKPETGFPLPEEHRLSGVKQESSEAEDAVKNKKAGENREALAALVSGRGPT